MRSIQTILILISLCLLWSSSYAEERGGNDENQPRALSAKEKARFNEAKFYLRSDYRQHTYPDFFPSEPRKKLTVTVTGEETGKPIQGLIIEAYSSPNEDGSAFSRNGSDIFDHQTKVTDIHGTVEFELYTPDAPVHWFYTIQHFDDHHSVKPEQARPFKFSDEVVTQIKETYQEPELIYFQFFNSSFLPLPNHTFQFSYKIPNDDIFHEEFFSEYTTDDKGLVALPGYSSWNFEFLLKDRESNLYCVPDESNQYSGITEVLRCSTKIHNDKRPIAVVVDKKVVNTTLEFYEMTQNEINRYNRYVQIDAYSAFNITDNKLHFKARRGEELEISLYLEDKYQNPTEAGSQLPSHKLSITPIKIPSLVEHAKFTIPRPEQHTVTLKINAPENVSVENILASINYEYLSGENNKRVSYYSNTIHSQPSDKLGNIVMLIPPISEGSVNIVLETLPKEYLGVSPITFDYEDLINNSTFNFELEKSSEIRGIVQDNSGIPVNKAVVELRGPWFSVDGTLFSHHHFHLFNL